MKEAAASIGLSWLGMRRSRGQPSLQTRYEDALRRPNMQYLRATAERPSWWRPGKSFVEEPIVPAALDAAMVPSLEHLGGIPEGAVVNCAGDDAAVPKKRCKKEHKEAGQTWECSLDTRPCRSFASLLVTPFFWLDICCGNVHHIVPLPWSP